MDFNTSIFKIIIIHEVISLILMDTNGYQYGCSERNNITMDIRKDMFTNINDQ